MNDHLPDDANLAQRIDEIADRFEDAWRRGQNPTIGDYLAAEIDRNLLLVELLQVDLQFQFDLNPGFRIETYLTEYVEIADHVELVLPLIRAEFGRREFRDQKEAVAEYVGRFPAFRQQILLGLDFPESKDKSPEHVDFQSKSVPQASHDTSNVPRNPFHDTQIWPDDQSASHHEIALPYIMDKFELIEKVGSGSFGDVYRAEDVELNRKVAIKLPRGDRFQAPQAVEHFVQEAKNVAKLHHIGIVPVYEVGWNKTIPYIVSHFVDGQTLYEAMETKRFTAQESARLAADIAEALHHAHQKKVVHRDLKPSNILIGSDGRVFISDFGLALVDENFGRKDRQGGTVAYMSPEQARFEGHLVDGRSDIFSLGVILYELLVGQHPFDGHDSQEILDRIKSTEARPPRQISSEIPTELERVCLKALANRQFERYTTALDLANDLRAYLLEHSTTSEPVLRRASVIPRGLRSFDQEDADFFLQLLPGPRTREGLPESIHFWKSKLESSDSDHTLRIGLLYGPSGCGKTSFAKAGLIPNLSTSIDPIYVESISNGTELRLLNELRKRAPEHEPASGLAETMAQIRHAKTASPGRKVVIFLDQFEQWLQSAGDLEGSELVAALRQCDGQHLQCVLMVRDDFWTAITRLMQELEVSLVERTNSVFVDLFDHRHACHVLTLFGQAYGTLPLDLSELSIEQRKFVEMVVQELADSTRKVTCVRLTLLAEMVKDQPWTPSAFRSVGGADGIGVTFLDERFGQRSGPISHRKYQTPIRNVLATLLPDGDTDVRDHVCSRNELSLASGFPKDSQELDDVLRILDHETRLLTPVDTMLGVNDADDEISGMRYQLTHDFLVRPLREWLNRKKKETARGRAEILLTERAIAWVRQQRSGHLPSFFEFAKILWHCPRTRQNDSERQMMVAATRYYLFRGGLSVAVCLIAISLAIGLMVNSRNQNRRTMANGLINQLATAEISAVPGIIQQLEQHQTWVKPVVERSLQDENQDSSQVLRLRLAKLTWQPDERLPLFDELLRADFETFNVLCDALRDCRDELILPLRSRLGDAAERNDIRFRAACALVQYEEGSDSIRTTGQHSEFLARELTRQIAIQPESYSIWTGMLRAVRSRLVASLFDIFVNPEIPSAERHYALSILADYESDDTTTLVRLIQNTHDSQQFNLILGHLQKLNDAKDVLRSELAQPFRNRKTEDEQEQRAKQQAHCAIALWKLGDEQPGLLQLKASDDLRLRTGMIHLFAAMDVDPKTLLTALSNHGENSVQRALIQALGEYQLDDLSKGVREEFIQILLELYETHPDSGVHSSLEWLLGKQWDSGSALFPLVRKLPDFEARGDRMWFRTRHGFTMAIIKEGAFQLGYRESDPFFNYDISSRPQQITRDYAISTTEITFEQFRKFKQPEIWERTKRYAPDDQCPAIVDWFSAAAFCNWLSEQEGLSKNEWCYEPNSEGQFDEGMMLADGFLDRIGYRLPSEVEWEYACRANTVTCRFFGQSTIFIDNYAWTQRLSNDRLSPVGHLKPNGYGLFDTLGNIREWCNNGSLDASLGYKQRAIAHESNGVQSGFTRASRGGSFTTNPLQVSATVRFVERPDKFNANYGFRVVRTIRPD